MPDKLCPEVVGLHKFVYGNGSERESLVAWMTRVDDRLQALRKLSYAVLGLVGTTWVTIIAVFILHLGSANA